MLLYLCSYLSAQDVQIIQSDSSFREQIDYVLDPLDLTQLSTQYLYEHTVPVFPLHRFDGTELHDTTLLDYSSFDFFYHMLRDMALSTDTLPAPQLYHALADSLESTDTIPIALVLHQYERFREDAVSANLLTVSNGQLQDVPGRPESPYLRDTTLLTSSLFNIFEGPNVVFIIRPEMLFGNLNPTTSALETDFDDGNGYTGISADLAIPISYTSPGIKKIRLKYSFGNGELRIGQFRIHIAAPPPTSNLRTYSIVPDTIDLVFRLRPDLLFSNTIISWGSVMIRKTRFRKFRKPVFIFPEMKNCFSCMGYLFPRTCSNNILHF